MRKYEGASRRTPICRFTGVLDEQTLRKLIEEAGGLTVEGIEGYGDVVLEKRYYRIARLVNSKYYLIKPLRH